MSQIQFKPFSVTMGKEPTNWWAELTILEELRKKGRENWTNEELNKYHQLTHLAGSWVTCACGNQCSIIPRNGIVPEDLELNRKGVKFYNDVKHLNVQDAIDTLEKIEKRAEELIKEILRNGKKE